MFFQLQPALFPTKHSQVAYIITLLASKARERGKACGKLGFSSCLNLWNFTDERINVSDHSLHCWESACEMLRMRRGEELQQSTPSGSALLPFFVVRISRPVMCSSMDCQREFRSRLPLEPLTPLVNWSIWQRELTRGGHCGEADTNWCGVQESQLLRCPACQRPSQLRPRPRIHARCGS